MMKYKTFTNIIESLNIKNIEQYRFIDNRNYNNMGCPGIGYRIKGGGYISIIRNGDYISRIIFEGSLMAPNQDVYNPNGLPINIVFKILKFFYEDIQSNK